MVDWLLRGEPRAVQIEALRRSYYGEALWDRSPVLFPEEENNEARDLGREGKPAWGWAHFMQMRTGKTPTILNEFELFRRDYDITKIVVLTPNKYKLDWPLEADRFGLGVPGFAYDSSDLWQAQRFVDRNKRGFLLAVNYDALVYEKNLAFLEGFIDERTYFATDESIKIKNPDGKFAKGALTLAKKAGVLRAASGKPITQGPHDYWSQLRFIREIDGFNFYAFRNTFCKMGGFQGKKVMGPKNEMRLQEILGGCSFFAQKIRWLKSAGVDYLERRVTLTDTQKKHYNQMQDDFLTELESGELVSADQIVTKLMKLQQISSGFLIDENGRTHDLIPPEKNPKILDVKQVLAEEIEDKLLIFCFHRRSMDMLMEALTEYNPAIIRGGMSNEEVIQQKAKFNGDPGCRVMVAQTIAVKYGNTLTGTPDDPCVTEYFFENTYSLDDRSQCEERPWTDTQETPITVMDVIATDHDYAPIRALQRKEDVSALLMRYDRSTGILPPRPSLPVG